MQESNLVSTPCEKRGSLIDDKKLENTFREAVGSLMYLATATRPDIAFSVDLVSQSLESPKQSDWQAVKRIFKYLRSTLSTKLLYRADYKPGILEAFSNADYARDIRTRRLTSGVVCKYFRGAISWMSQKQRSVVLSTTEAEFVAASEETKEVIWLKRLLQEVTVLKEVPTLMIDNASAIKLVKNPEFHKRSYMLKCVIIS